VDDVIWSSTAACATHRPPLHSQHDKQGKGRKGGSMTGGEHNIELVSRDKINEALARLTRNGATVSLSTSARIQSLPCVILLCLQNWASASRESNMHDKVWSIYSQITPLVVQSLYCSIVGTIDMVVLHNVGKANIYFM
jgi:hypothetical protein